MFSYDQMPYESHSFVLTHPAHLGAIARLFGVASAPAESARVLEFGCGQGWNMIASASTLPEAQHVGVDLGRIHIEEGRAAVQALGLHNVELLEGDFQTCPESGPFDYIIAHGLLSWVTPALADALLVRASALLAPGGVLYVSYNCLPGWHARLTIRDAMHFRVRGIEDGPAKVEAALGYLAFLANTAPPYEDLYRAFLAKQARELAAAPSFYLRHEHLSDDNHPLYVRDVVARAGAAGLDYLGDASLRAHPCFTLPARVFNALGRLAEDPIELEQHTDFITNRSFRRSLFIKRDTARHAPFPRLSEVVAADLWVSSHAARKGAPHDNIFVWGEARIERPPWSIVRALDTLAELWPNAMRLGDLFDRMIGGGQLDDVVGQRSGFSADVIGLVGLGLIELTTCPPRAVRAGLRPRASALSRHMIACGKTIVSSLRHDSVQLDATDRFLTSLLDGTRDRPQLIEALSAAMTDGRVETADDMTHAGLPVTTANTVALARDLDARLARLGAVAILEA